MASKQKTSSAWNYFTEEDGTPFAVCKLCSAKIKRGKAGDKKTLCLISETLIKLCRYIYYSR